MLKFLIGDAVDYEAIIKEKFPNCNVEVIQPDFLEMDMLIEYITDDIIYSIKVNVDLPSHLIVSMQYLFP